MEVRYEIQTTAHLPAGLRPDADHDGASGFGGHLPGHCQPLAKSYIEEMTDAGMFKGYEDGTFKPENKLTTAEALALCARAVPVKQGIADRIASTARRM
jgi:hypothetical protein